MTTTAVVQRNPAAELRAFLSAPNMLTELSKVLPANLKPERMIRQVLTLASKNPALLECSPVSVWAGLVQAAELGLEMSGVLGQAYLVPRWNSKKRCKEATFQIGYRGLSTLAYRSGMVLVLQTRIVYENDDFQVSYGSMPLINHHPYMGPDPGKPVAYYAVAKLKAGGEDFEVMSIEQVQAHRMKYSPPSDRQSTWDTNFDEMALKTPLRKLCKRLPLSADVIQAAVADEYGEVLALPESVRVSQTETVSGLLDAVLPEESFPSPSVENPTTEE